MFVASHDDCHQSHFVIITTIIVILRTVFFLIRVPVFVGLWKVIFTRPWLSVPALVVGCFYAATNVAPVVQTNVTKSINLMVVDKCYRTFTKCHNNDKCHNTAAKCHTIYHHQISYMQRQILQGQVSSRGCAWVAWVRLSVRVCV